VVLLILLGKESGGNKGSEPSGETTQAASTDGTTDNTTVNTTDDTTGDTPSTDGGDTTTDTDAPGTEEGWTTDPAPIADKAEIGRGFYLVSFESYSGPYFEDMSDDDVTGIAAAVIRNDGAEMIQLVDFSVYVAGEAYEFRATTIPSGAEMLVLEKNRAKYPARDFEECAVTMIAEFPEEPSVHEDELKVSGVDGTIYVENRSGADIDSDIAVYYKTFRDGRYVGGITYVATFRGGIASGVSNMLGAAHFDIEDSRIMFINYGE
ncbi:MAG: hypothetical protein IJQ80_03230, partial [Clostridia bacterium]|nr:hypothetical protein [Clostridia bacterium]